MTIINTKFAEIWGAVLNNVEKELNDKTVFSNFFSNTQIVSIEGDTITIVAENSFAATVIKNKYLELVKLLFQIWAKRYDIVISSGSNKFIAIYLFLTFVRERYGYNTGKLSEKLLTKTVKLNKNQYAVNMYHDLAKSLVDSEVKLPQLSIQKKPKIENTILIHPGVSKISLQKGIVKTITATEWARVINLLYERGKKVLLIGGPDDNECIESILKEVEPHKFENLYGSTKNLKELAELISQAEIFLCSDSAPLHIAVALETQTYVIFGSTDEEKLIPKSEKVIPIKSDIKCPLQPCLWEKRQTSCSDPVCLKISAEKVVETILN